MKKKRRRNPLKNHDNSVFRFLPQPLRKRDRVFESFYKVDPSRTESGFGLGLYICREIIAAHGEKIWAEQSEELGGAKFIYTLNDNAPEDKDPKENP